MLRLLNHNYYLKCDCEDELKTNKGYLNFDLLNSKTKIEEYKSKSKKFDCATTILSLINAVLVISGLIF
jgi:hypothetical protein